MGESVNYETLEITSSEYFFISQELDCLSDFNERNFVVLDRLCKKIDVTKKVLKVYSGKFLSMKDKQEELSHEEYLQLGRILLRWAREKRDFKFLNSAFKLADLIQDDSLMREAQIVLGEME
ncbi:hypothetical protein CCZ01_08095 [Helicobacter monodelphidis]|uniref:hypothetical protein n=1 Tax=Helicobacter sp. 15-1451 TaxID=2004995 RepID=UPI000DCF538D|nr:hypothetical protein [Helicobacter sp. 15-1451]RAX56891.1 hypothetical protein CCZ01_08095 [Helicobacter sp. 15-1451]